MSIKLKCINKNNEFYNQVFEYRSEHYTYAKTLLYLKNLKLNKVKKLMGLRIRMTGVQDKKDWVEV